MAYIDTTYVDNAIGSDVRSAVAPTTAAFNQFEAAARARIKEAASGAGYTLGDTTTSAQVQDLTLGVFIILSYSQTKGITVPPEFRDTFYRLDDIRTGKAKLIDYTPSSRDGVGGATFSATSGTSGRPQVFDRKSTSQW